MRWPDSTRKMAGCCGARWVGRNGRTSSRWAIRPLRPVASMWWPLAAAMAASNHQPQCILSVWLARTGPCFGSRDSAARLPAMNCMNWRSVPQRRQSIRGRFTCPRISGFSPGATRGTARWSGSGRTRASSRASDRGSSTCARGHRLWLRAGGFLLRLAIIRA